MIRSSFNRYLNLVICMIGAVFLAGAVIAAMRGEIPFALASQETGLLEPSQEPFLVKDINPTGDSEPQILTNSSSQQQMVIMAWDCGAAMGPSRARR